MIYQLLDEIKNFPDVCAIAIGGSRANVECGYVNADQISASDKKSDYDIYVYVDKDISEDVRRSAFAPFCSHMEIGNKYWETEDNIILKDDVPVDIIYRWPNSFAEDMASVVEKFYPHNGYTTCMWHNLKYCISVYDPKGVLANLKNRFDVPYPVQLKKNIIERNYKLLTGVMPSYDLQIRKSLERNDCISIGHRTAAFFESYFDIIFALNELTHPGEKRLKSMCVSLCKILPQNFERNIDSLLKNLYSGDTQKVMSILDSICSELKKTIDGNL